VGATATLREGEAMSKLVRVRRVGEPEDDMISVETTPFRLAFYVTEEAGTDPEILEIIIRSSLEDLTDEIEKAVREFLK